MDWNQEQIHRSSSIIFSWNSMFLGCLLWGVLYKMRCTFTWSAPPAAQHGWLLIFAYASHYAMLEHRPRSLFSATENRLALIISAQMLAVLRASGHGGCSLLVRAAAAIVVRMSSSRDVLITYGAQILARKSSEVAHSQQHGETTRIKGYCRFKGAPM